jgi:hypothetical protein
MGNRPLPDLRYDFRTGKWYPVDRPKEPEPDDGCGCMSMLIVIVCCGVAAMLTYAFMLWRMFR